MRSKASLRAIAALGTAAGALAGLLAASVPAALGAPVQTVPEGLTYVAAHPAAQFQSTQQGQILADLEVHNGKVYAGYGDYTANTGPIMVSSVDASRPDAGFTDEFLADTEAIYNFRVIGEDLVIPAIDPRSKADFVVSGPWRQERPLGAAHVFDTASTADGLWMVGSHGVDAVAWRSVDDGGTWTEALRVPPADSSTYSRFYFAGVLDGELRVQAFDARGGEQPTSLGFDGIGWHERPSMLLRGDRGWSPEPFAGGLVYHSQGQAERGAVRFFDGSTVTTLENRALDVEVTENAVWVLRADDSVAFTRDLVSWTEIGSGPRGSSSIAADEQSGEIWIGTNAAELWQLEVPTALPSEDSVIEPGDSGPTEGRSSTEHCPKGWQRKGRC